VADSGNNRIARTIKCNSPPVGDGLPRSGGPLIAQRRPSEPPAQVISSAGRCGGFL
jgi:hypothetical protein